MELRPCRRPFVRASFQLALPTPSPQLCSGGGGENSSPVASSLSLSTCLCVASLFQPPRKNPPTLRTVFLFSFCVLAGWALFFSQFCDKRSRPLLLSFFIFFPSGEGFVVLGFVYGNFPDHSFLLRFMPSPMFPLNPPFSRKVPASCAFFFSLFFSPPPERFLFNRRSTFVEGSPPSLFHFFQCGPPPPRVRFSFFLLVRETVFFFWFG